MNLPIKQNSNNMSKNMSEIELYKEAYLATKGVMYFMTLPQSYWQSYWNGDWSSESKYDLAVQRLKTAEGLIKDSDSQRKDELKGYDLPANSSLDLSNVTTSVAPKDLELRPKIICLVGSTRFIEQFAIKTWELERQGYIVLGCPLLPTWYCKVESHFAEKQGVKKQFDELHQRKIDLADEVLVLNIGGYIGESTRTEINYALKNGKPVKFLEDSPSKTPIQTGGTKIHAILTALNKIKHRILILKEGGKFTASVPISELESLVHQIEAIKNNLKQTQASMGLDAVSCSK